MTPALTRTRLGSLLSHGLYLRSHLRPFANHIVHFMWHLLDGDTQLAPWNLTLVLHFTFRYCSCSERCYLHCYSDYGNTRLWQRYRYLNLLWPAVRSHWLTCQRYVLGHRMTPTDQIWVSNFNAVHFKSVIWVQGECSNFVPFTILSDSGRGGQRFELAMKEAKNITRELDCM